MGPAKVVLEGKSRIAACIGGMLSVINGEVRLIATTFEWAEDIDRERAKSALEGMKDRYAVLLGNHGLLAGGADLPSAFDTAEEIEFCAEIYYKCKLAGEPVLLSEEQMDVVLKKFETYGVQPEIDE